ncbi:MAG: alpha-glucan family phosphorylase [Patescibacteria group bacterium]
MPQITPHNPIAYFCFEYGLQTNWPFYAGGLGVLAGDTVKQAADQNLPFVALGLMYRGEGIVQQIDQDGMQQDRDMIFEPLSAGLEHVYLDDQPLFIRVHLSELDIWARVWKKSYAPNVTLYLLDTDTDQNQLPERSITHALYTGNEEVTLKQQFVLGVGGVKLLQTLGIHPSVYHLNEGRPALMLWQVIRQLMDEHGMDYRQARELAVSKTVYTNHTLVAAGNNSVDLSLIRRYAKYYADKMAIGVDQLLELGISPEAPDRFSMATFSLNSSHRANGVSQIHSKLSAEQWPQYLWTNVTNGVHLPTWQDPELAKPDLNDEQLWQIHQANKRRLAEFVSLQTGFGYDPHSLVISWARRLAGYKRVEAIFEDIERLRAILRQVDRPVQLLVSGKAHMLDQAGKIRLQTIIKYMAKELSGHALFIPNYNLDVAKMLVRGSDVWLNLPEFGMEASGTSGMKAIANGVLQCTVPDGWAHEVDWYGLGWTLDDNRVSADLYEKLEQQIVPLYFERNTAGIPEKWLQMMRGSINLAQQFSAKRMLQEYLQKLY